MAVVFLDRDGVINENRDDYVKSWDEFRFLPGAIDALRLLTQQGCRIFVVTNQACINRGLASASTVADMHRRLALVAEANGAQISDVRFCPHRPEEECRCRKPQPGMLLDIAHAHGLSLSHAYMIGDAASDIAAGRAVGCRTVMVQTGRGASQLAEGATAGCQPDSIAANLLSAARWICAHEAPHQLELGAAPRRAHNRIERFPATVLAGEHTESC